MATCIEADTLDDLMRRSIQALLDTGHRSTNAPERGPNTEMVGVTLQLNHPRNRLSRTESRRRPMSAIGELAWYLSGSNVASQVGHWVPRYKNEAEEDGRVHGAYGPRLFGDGIDAQFHRIVQLLRDHPATRRAVIQLFDRSDTYGERKKDIPCTCTLQFLLRDGLLHMVTSMRSNDAVLGFPHDVFAFTMLQEIAACELGLELGMYIHQAASFHVYDVSRELAEKFLEEGWQSQLASMPAMSAGSQGEFISQFLVAEAQLRDDRLYAELDLPDDPYWADLVRVLAAGNARHRGDQEERSKIIEAFSNDGFREFARQGMIQ